MSWFSRNTKKISTTTSHKNDTPDNYWKLCPSCNATLSQRELDQHERVCHHCGHHFSLDAQGYFDLLFDGDYQTFDEHLSAVDALKFVDKKPYPARLSAAKNSTGLSDAARAALGEINGIQTSVACMDFKFIGGSMGSVVGEVLTRAIRRGVTHNCPVIIISQSGGARMMEAALSLMQMAKTSANLAVLAEKGLPYISIMTHPTTGGVTASYAMLGDINLAEPNALIGFAGPRVIRETIGQDLPDGFQRSEFLVEKGFLDDVIDRRHLKSYLGTLLHHLTS